MNVDDLKQQITERLIADHHGRQRAGSPEVPFNCVFHEDAKASASWHAAKGVFKCHGCGKKGGWKDLAGALHLELPKASKAKAKARTKAKATIVAEYPYTDANSLLRYQSVRFQPKDFRQRRPDGNGGWIWNLDGVELVLYRLPEVLAAPADATVYLNEGEKDTNRLWSLGLVATTAPCGAEAPWRDGYTETLRNRHVVILPDNDDAGERHAQKAAQALFRHAKSVRIVRLDGRPAKGDVSDWLDAGHTVAELQAVTAATEPLRPVTLADVRAVFRKWMHFLNDDDSALLAVLGAVATSYMAGEPCWLLLIGRPSGGKTEILAAVRSLPNVHSVATLTEAALLSGTPAHDQVAGAAGGLLREIGDRGTIVLKDFGSVLSMPRDPRAATLAALRELYDGDWTRRVGSDGGRELHWHGRLTLVAGCTEVIENYTAVTAALGERFVQFRLPPADDDRFAEIALTNAGREHVMRRELADAVSRLFAATDFTAAPASFNQDDRRRLVKLAQFAARSRSAVYRESGVGRQIELIPEPEAPARLVKALAGLYRGLLALGAPHADAWEIVRKAGTDCLPKLRRSVLQAVADAGQTSTSKIAELVDTPTVTVRRSLEDLAAHKMVKRTAGGEGKADLWELSQLGHDLYAHVTEATTLSQMSQTGVCTTTDTTTDTAKTSVSYHRGGDDFWDKVPPLEHPTEQQDVGAGNGGNGSDFNELGSTDTARCRACGGLNWEITTAGATVCRTCHPAPAATAGHA